MERAKADMQLKMDQTQPSLVDGATCTGKLTVAETKLKVIRARLMALDSQAASSGGEPLPADLEEEIVTFSIGPPEFDWSPIDLQYFPKAL